MKLTKEKATILKFKVTLFLLTVIVILLSSILNNIEKDVVYIEDKPESKIISNQELDFVANRCVQLSDQFVICEKGIEIGNQIVTTSFPDCYKIIKSFLGTGKLDSGMVAGLGIIGDELVIRGRYAKESEGTIYFIEEKTMELRLNKSGKVYLNEFHIGTITSKEVEIVAYSLGVSFNWDSIEHDKTIHYNTNPSSVSVKRKLL